MHTRDKVMDCNFVNKLIKLNEMNADIVESSYERKQ